MLLIFGAIVLVLLVLSNSFFIYLLFENNKTDGMTPDPYEQMCLTRSVFLSYDQNPSANPDSHKKLIALKLKDYPSILRTEPIILIAKPELKPVIAEILEEDPSILKSDPFTLYDYPELVEINPNLKPILNDILENRGDSYEKELFKSKQLY